MSTVNLLLLAQNIRDLIRLDTTKPANFFIGNNNCKHTAKPDKVQVIKMANLFLHLFSILEWYTLYIAFFIGETKFPLFLLETEGSHETILPCLAGLQGH